MTAYVRQMTRLPGFHVDFKLSDASVGADRVTGYVYGDSAITHRQPDGTLLTTRQRLLTVWRKERSGWHCYLDIVIPPAAP